MVVATALVLPASAAAFERDVHYGLTKWLALKAGFTMQQADALATGDQRVDSGDMQFLELVTAYACFGKNRESASLVEQHHYPAAVDVPAPAEQRAVVAGSDQARKRAADAANVLPKQASFLLFRFAETLHALQDSYSHQGAPDVPHPLDGAVPCDPTLAWAHPHARGGWNSHVADLTHKWPADTMAMAKATYDLLLQFAPIDGNARSPRAWPEIAPLLDGFVRASTKNDKQRWFAAQGMDDVSFLEGITLPDGAAVFDQRWNAHKLTALTTLAPTQHGVDAALADFYRRFFTQWMATEDFDALAKTFGAPPAPELAARLRAWRIRDHGRVAELAHQVKPLTAAQRNTLSTLAKQRNALITYASPADAFFPLQVKDRDAAPLQAFLVGPIQTTARGTTQAAATAKLRHAPYDTIVVNAELVAGTWRIVGVDAIVDH